MHDREWARQRCEEVVRTCRVAAVDGTTLFTPDGIGHYGALWTRDFAYLVDHGGEFLDAGETRAAIDVLLAGQRADGAVPDRVDRQLVPIFHPGGIGNPLGAGPALDNPMFLVSLVARHHRRHGDDELRQAALPALRRALAWVPRNRGLVFNDAQRPSCTYGFQDTVAKGGHDLFCTLLFVVACRQMADLDPADGAAWRERAAEAEAGLWLLWDDEQGAWLAASEICRQIDVWGNAFAVAHGIGPADSRQRAARWLATHLDDCVHDGQVRHLAVRGRRPRDLPERRLLGHRRRLAHRGAAHRRRRGGRRPAGRSAGRLPARRHPRVGRARRRQGPRSLCRDHRQHLVPRARRVTAAPLAGAGPTSEHLIIDTPRRGNPCTS
jgi:hypothetical protein